MSDTNEVLPWRVRRPRPVEAFVSRTARRAAAELGVDPAQIAGTGLNGRVTRDDVLAGRTGPARGDEVVPFNNIRKRAAGLLLASKRTSAHTLCVGRAPTTRRSKRCGATRGRNGAAREGFSLTYLPFVARAVVDGLRAYPLVNAGVDGEIAGRTPRDQSRHRGGPRFPGPRRARRAQRGRPPPPRARPRDQRRRDASTRQEAHARRFRGRDVHHHEPGRIGYLVVVPHHQPAPGRDRRHRRRVEAGDRRRRRAGS